MPVPREIAPNPPIVVRPIPVPAEPSTRECPFCAELIQAAAKKCRHCGELLDPVLRSHEEARRLAERAPAPAPAPVIVHNVNTVSSSAKVAARAVAPGRQPSSCFGCMVLLVFSVFGLAILGLLAPRTPEPTPPPIDWPAPAPIPPQLPAEEPEPAPAPAPADERPPDPKPIPEPKEPEAPPNPAFTKEQLDRAEVKLRMGRALERNNPAGALGYYREVIEQFPGTPEAKRAAARIKVLGKAK